MYCTYMTSAWCFSLIYTTTHLLNVYKKYYIQPSRNILNNEWQIMFSNETNKEWWRRNIEWNWNCLIMDWDIARGKVKDLCFGNNVEVKFKTEWWLLSISWFWMTIFVFELYSNFMVFTLSQRVHHRIMICFEIKSEKLIGKKYRERKI